MHYGETIAGKNVFSFLLCFSVKKGRSHTLSDVYITYLIEAEL